MLNTHCRLSKFVPVTQNLLLNIKHDITGQADVFDVSPREAQIINHHGSLFVIGRSGQCLFSAKQTIVLTDVA